MKTSFALLALAAVTTGKTAAADNLLTNGSFEHGNFHLEVTYSPDSFGDRVHAGETDLTGWTIGLSPIDPDGVETRSGLEWTEDNIPGLFPDGQRVIDLVNGVEDYYKISTFVATIPGRQYLLSYAVMGGGAVHVRVSGSSTNLDFSATVPEDLTWRDTTVSFTADAGSSLLGFWVLAGGTVVPFSGPFLDNIIVVEDKQQPSLALAITAGLPSIALNGAVGSTYRIEYATGLPLTNWLELTNVTLPVSPYVVSDNDPKTNALRFYRAVAVP